MKSVLRIRDGVASPVAGFRELPSAADIANEAERLRLLGGL
jgi:hypothetical protein